MRLYPVPMISTLGKGHYEKMLMNPKAKDSLMEIKCTERTILYNVLVISGLVGNLVVKILKEKEVPGHIVFDLMTLTFIKE